MPIGDRFRSSSTTTTNGAASQPSGIPPSTMQPVRPSGAVHRPLPPYLLAQELHGIVERYIEQRFGAH